MIFNFFQILLILKKNSNFFLKSFFKNYVACHVAKVAQSATATWRTTCQISWDVGQGPFSNNFFFQRCSLNFFFTRTKTKTRPNYMDENHI